MNVSNFLNIATNEILNQCFIHFFICVYEGSTCHKYIDCLYLFDQILNHISQDALITVLSRSDIKIEDYIKLLSLVDAESYGQIFNNRLDHTALNVRILETILDFGYNPDSETIFRLFIFLIRKGQGDTFKNLARYFSLDSELTCKLLDCIENFGGVSDDLKSFLNKHGE